MSPEQLDWFTVQTEHAAQKAAHSAVLRFRRPAVVGYLLLLLGVLFAIGLGAHESNAGRNQIVESGRAVAVNACNARYEDRVKFRTLLTRLKVAAAASTRSTAEQKEAAIKFYNGQLDSYKLFDCRDAENLLTADPHAKIPHIAPFYPGAEGAPEVPDLTVPSESG